MLSDLTRFAPSTLTALALGVSALTLAADGARLTHAPAEGQTLEITAELEFEALATDSEISVDGQPLPEDDRPPGYTLEELTLELALSAEYAERGFQYLEGELMSFVRELGTARIGGLPLPLPSPLEDGARIAYRRSDPSDDFGRVLVREDDDQGKDDPVLALLHPDLLYSELAPEDVIELDDTWSAEVDANLFVRMLMPGLDLDGLGELAQGLGFEGFVSGLVLALPDAMDRGLSGARLDLRVTELIEDERGTLARIEVSGQIELDMDLTEAIQTLADASTTEEVVVIDRASCLADFAVEGELLWRAGETSHLTGYQLDLDGPFRLEVEGETDEGITILPMEALLAWDVVHSTTVDVAE